MDNSFNDTTDETASADTDDNYLPYPGDDYTGSDPADTYDGGAGAYSLAEADEPEAVAFELPELPMWTGADYAGFITGSGADKLADSAVAPLVAAARGYRRLDAGNFADEAKRMSLKGTTNQGKRLKRSITAEGQDGMQMPWYSVAGLQSAERKGEQAEPHTYQVRPSHPEDNEHGKPIKYDFLSGVGTPLDLHPATPVSWIDTTPIVMFAEGMLKGDSALSAYLRSMGVDWDTLAGKDSTDPVADLRAAMETIPEKDRILIVSIAGIHNAHQHPVDWREIDLKGREGWIAFDADLGENPFVHKAALKLWEYLDEKAKMAKLKVLNPTTVSGESGSIAKCGVDDYLAKIGNWKQLLSFMSTSMPPAPARNTEEKPGAWRISPDGKTTEECVPVMGGPGGTLSGYRWEERLDLGGRVLAIESVRQPTDQELATGNFDPNVNPSELYESRAEIEISWSRDGRDFAVNVSGPETILMYQPADWDRKGATIPRELLLHPSWPPAGAKGLSFLSAVKANRSMETVMKTRWMQMGWVPVEGGNPAFIIGETVVGDSDLGANVTPGVNKEVLDMAPHFGVGETAPGDWDDPEYREQVRKDFRAVVDAYIVSEAWTDPGTAALVLAGALRPCVPLRPRSTLFFWGPKNRGKSWSAKTMMYFWQRRNRGWMDQLPGSAKDTLAFLESVVSMSPIWVVDDLAPSTSKKQAEMETAKLEDLTRAIFNNASKGRMNADMTSRKSNKPIAQLVITAENELVTPSAKERLIPAHLGPGKLHLERKRTDRIDIMAKEEGTQSRLTGHVLSFIRWDSLRQSDGWAGMVNHFQAQVQDYKNMTADIMKQRGIKSSNLDRSSTLAADVMLAFAVLHEMALHLDLEAEYVKMFSTKGIGQDIAHVVADAHTENQEASPGRALTKALASVLKAGQAHVISGDDPTRAPLASNAEGDAIVNHQLGWTTNGGSEGALRPLGPTVGTLVEMNDQKIIIFAADTAFNIAQAKFPEMIPHGQAAAAAWAGVWEEGLVPESLERRRNTNGKLKTTIRTRAGQARISGVPLELYSFLSDFTEDD